MTHRNNHTITQKASKIAHAVHYSLSTTCKKWRSCLMVKRVVSRLKSWARLQKHETNRAKHPLPPAITFIEDEITIDLLAIRKGYLPWRAVLHIAWNNLVMSRSRTFITIGAIAIGIAAIIFLTSFSYGLQQVVTSRLIRPNTLRLTDVVSDSTALRLNKKTLTDITRLGGVEKVAPQVSLSGAVGVGGSRMDVVLVAVRNSFIELSNLTLLHGNGFSKQAEDAFIGSSESEISMLQKQIATKMDSASGQVAGVATRLPTITLGAQASANPVRFRVRDLTYLPIRKSPVDGAEILGYMQGTILTPQSGTEVWGGEYVSSGTEGRTTYAADGKWYGKWIRSTFLLYKEEAPTVYMPVLDDSGKQKSVEGYIPQRNIYILSDVAYTVEKDLAAGEVLGEQSSAEESSASSSASTNLMTLRAASSAATEAAALEKLVKSKQTSIGGENKSSSSLVTGVVEIKKKNGKEIIVSSSFAKRINTDIAKVVGKSLDLEFIIGGGLIPGVQGRVLTKKQTYTVVAVVQDEKKSYAFVPLADLESVGVETYSSAKVLVKDPLALKDIRSRIESMGFSTTSVADTIAQVNKLFSLMRYLLTAFGLVAFVVAIIGMFNTLTVTLLERTREVAVMKTMGTTDHDVARLFVVESMIMGSLGGVAGIVLGLLVGFGVDVLFMVLRKDMSTRLFVTPAFMIGGMLAVSVVIGGITGIYPALRSRLINPLDAIRYE